MNKPIYDKEIYDIAYNSKSMKEAWEIAQKYTDTYGSYLIVGIALHQASIRLRGKTDEQSD